MDYQKLKKRYHKKEIIENKEYFFVQQKETLGCLNCDLKGTVMCDDLLCSKHTRKDSKSGIFVLVENVKDLSL